MNTRSGQVLLRGSHSERDAPAEAPAVHHDLLAGALARDIRRNGPRRVRLFETLPGIDGLPHHVLIVGFPVGDLDGRSHYFGGVALDITSHQLLIDELAHQALVDQLTGLYNLRGFLLLAEHEVRMARRRGTRTAVVYADVDELKQINDGYGHEHGSRLLVETAALLRGVFRECNVIGRLGGDEFAVLATDVQDDPELLCQRLKTAVAARDADAGALSLSVGVGALAAGPQLRLADLLAAADRAMYRNKSDRARQAVGAPAAAPDHEGP